MLTLIRLGFLKVVFSGRSQFDPPPHSSRFRVKIRDYCHITGKYRDSAHRDCNIHIFGLNHKIPVVFYNLKNYYSYPIMQEQGKFNFKINIIQNGLEYNVSFTINTKLSLIDSFQFLSSSGDSLAKNLNKDDFKSRI